MSRWGLMAIAAVLAFCVLGPPASAADKKSPPAKKEKEAVKKPAAGKKTAATATRPAAEKIQLDKPVVCKLEEVPAYGVIPGDPAGNLRFPRGVSAQTSLQPMSAVKAYPKLKSDRPLYGSVTLMASYFEPREARTLYFVVDRIEGKEKSADASQLWFDLNGDLDLTNDKPVQAMAKPPFEGLPGRTATFFGELPVLFDLGPGLGKRAFPLVARMPAGSNGMIDFLPTTARRGKLQLGKGEYFVWLSQSQFISGRFDQPFVEFRMYLADPSKNLAPPLRSGMLGEVRRLNDKFVSLTATPSGDQLTIGPYQGDLGTVEVGPGGRTITEMGIAGTLVSQTGTMPLGESLPLAPETLSRRHSIPVGDYRPLSLTVQMGRLRFSCRMAPDYAAGSGSQAKTPTFGMAVRKDKPCVLEFSGKPEVRFMNPEKKATFKPGDQVYIRAMLTEPWQGIQITGLSDTSQPKGKSTYRIEGREISVPNYARLDPTIVIKNSLGEKVSEGKMPFG